MGTENEALLKRFFDWLCSMYPTSDPPELCIAPEGYRVIEADGEYGFGVYVPAERTINVVQTAPPELEDEEQRRALCCFLAHEYRHHMQVTNGWPMSEEEAEAFAESVADRWLRECNGEMIGDVSSL
ncbi:MAG: hypothetical protein IRZ33_10975 [Alicyclobacillaceae bacterium]|nr:hypothetical protein [Alicyclobacillaceae bacterium]